MKWLEGWTKERSVMSNKSNAYAKGYSDRELGNRKQPQSTTWLKPHGEHGKKAKEIRIAYENGWNDAAQDGRAKDQKVF